MLNSSFNPTTLTKDNFTVTKINYFFKNDINVGFGLVKDFLDHHEIFKKNVRHFSNNCLLIQGEDDAIVDPKITTEIFRNLNSTDKTVKLIEGGFHELYSDKEKKGVSIMMVDWILDRTEDKAQSLGILKNIRLRTKMKNKKTLSFISQTTAFFVYLFIIRYLLKIKEYRQSRLRLLFFPIYWIFKIIKIFFKRQSNALIRFFESYKNEIRI